MPASRMKGFGRPRGGEDIGHLAQKKKASDRGRPGMPGGGGGKRRSREGRKTFADITRFCGELSCQLYPLL